MTEEQKQVQSLSQEQSIISQSSLGTTSSRSSIMSFASEMRGRRAFFYRNGDAFFQAMQYVVAPEHFRSIDSLKTALTRTVVGDSHLLSQGVRVIFTTDGEIISDIDDIEDGASYVCASTKDFKPLPYCDIMCKRRKWSSLPPSKSTESIRKPSSLHSAERLQDPDRHFITPKIINIVENKGNTTTAKSIRFLLNKKTAHSIEQVLGVISDAMRLDNGAVRRLFNINGMEVRTLQDFYYGNSTTFFACTK